MKIIKKILTKIKKWTHLKSKKKFRTKKLGHTSTYNSYLDIFTNMSIKSVIKFFVFFISLGIILFYSKYIFQIATAITASFSHTAISVISENFGTGMKQDEHGNVNVLLIGMGGDKHAGGHLADSIIVASFNPQRKSVSMISIPRDFYVYDKELGYRNRINAVFAFEYSNSQGNLKYASKALQKKVGQILGVNIPYYAVIDFKGFEGLIDSLGGVFVDVSNTIHDTYYPGPNHTYQTFRIEAGPQMLDGETALKYARSRKTTSDFSRSARQQKIIKAILKQGLDTSNISVSKIKEMYKQYTKMVFTNIEVKEMIGMMKYGLELPDIFSFGLTYECQETWPSSIEAGCLLIPGVREDFNGMSILLPKGANGRKPDFYDYLHFFAYMVMENSKYLQENFKINIYNAIDIKYARKYSARYRNGLATKMGGKLRRYGFDIGDIDNFDKGFDKTTAIIYKGNNYSSTFRMLKLFLPIDNIIEYNNMTGEDTIEGLIHSKNISGHIEGIDGNTIDLYLGKDFIDKFGRSRFNMYKK